MHYLEVGDEVFFESEKCSYHVMACNDQFAICTNKQNNLYTIIDWAKNQRNRNNLIFNPYDYKKQEDIEKCLRDLSDRKHVCEISQRGAVKLDIVNVVKG